VKTRESATGHQYVCLSLYLHKSWLQSAYRVGHSTETAVLRSCRTFCSPSTTATYLHWCSGSTWGHRHDGSRHFDPAPENVLRSVWNGAAVVPGVPGRPVPVRPNRSLSISSNSDRVWCTAGVRSWPYLVPAVHCRPDSADPGSRSLPTSVRRRHTDLRVLPTVCITGAPEHHHQLC